MNKLLLAAIVAAILSPGVASALDTRYSDTDGDMVADVPKNPAELVDPPVLVFAYTPVEDPAVYTTEFAPRIVRVERRTSDGLPVFYLIPILGCAGTDYDALTPYASAVWQNAVFAMEPGSPDPQRGLTFNASTDAVLGASDGLWVSYDFGATWDRAVGMPVGAVLGAGVLPDAAGRPLFWAGMEGGGLWLSRNAAGWRAGGLAGRSVFQVITDPDGGGWVAATDAGIYAARAPQFQ